MLPRASDLLGAGPQDCDRRRGSIEGTVPGARLSPVEAEKIYQARYGKSLESVAYEIGDRGHVPFAGDTKIQDEISSMLAALRASEPRFCGGCGAKMRPGAKFCGACGQSGPA